MAEADQRWGYGLPDQAPLTAPAAHAPAGPERWRHLRGDFVGGVTAAMLTIPISVGYGLLALSPLGQAATPSAILAGLYAPFFGCLVALLLGARTTMVYAPRSVGTFLIGSFVLHDLARSNMAYLHSVETSALIAMAFLLVLFAGAFQTIIGLLRLGSVIKYIPSPVIAGFQNAAALLLFMSQFEVMLGLPHRLPLLSLPAHLDLVQPLTLLVGVLTCALVLRGAKVTKRVPPTILGLIGGILTFYLFANMGLRGSLGQTVGTLQSGLPSPAHLLDFIDLFRDPRFYEFLPVLLAGAASVAIVASLDAVMCARLIQTDSGHKFESNRELVRLGIGNMVGAAFGTIASGINLASSFANHRSGGRTAFSVVVLAVSILVAVQLLPPVIAIVPRVVIGAMLVVVGIQLVDRWTISMLKKIAKRQVPLFSSAALDLSIVLLVTTMAIAANLVFAVALGIAVTILFFLFRMSKSVIRRAYLCNVVHSRKTRDPRLGEILTRHGQQILVAELEGPIFFGTADNLATYLDGVSADVTYIILDFKRVNEVDSTGAKVILQIHDRLTKDGKHLALSSMPENGALARFLRDMGVTTALSRGRLFADVDRAIEWAEDHLILARMGDVEVGSEFPYGQLDVFARLSEPELAVIKDTLTRRAYAKGDLVFREGETSDELYVIAKGTASVRLRLGVGSETRLITFSPGTVFGELALLDQEARSASVEADDELVCYVLTRERFDELTRHHPAIAIKVLTNLGRELSSRLRRANRTIYQLAS